MKARLNIDDILNAVNQHSKIDKLNVLWIYMVFIYSMLEDLMSVLLFIGPISLSRLVD